MRFTFLNHHIASVHAAAFLLGAAGLLSRVLGVLRDRLLAGTFGAGRELDAYYAAFQIPDFISVLFLLGAGTAAILPVFQDYVAKDRERAHRLISRLTTTFLIVSLGVAALVFVAAPALVRFIVPGFPEVDRALVVTLTRIMLFSPILLGLSSILASVVQSFQRFFAYALAPIFYNVGIILGILFFIPRFGVAGLGLGVLFGAFLHFFVQWVSVWALGFAPRFAWGDRGAREGIRKIAGLAFPRVLSISLSQLTLVALVAIGSTLEKGSVAVFSLAQNLYALPIGVFGVSYATALFPRLSRFSIARDANNFFREFFIGIRSILFWIAPTAILFIVLRAHIVRVAFGTGAFSWEDTRLTAAVLAAFTIAMFEGSLTTYFMKGFYALESTWAPLWVNIASSAVSIGGALSFTRLFIDGSPFAEGVKTVFRVSDIAHAEVLGLAFGFTIGLVINIIFLYFFLIRRARSILGGYSPFPWMPVAKILFASLVAGAVAYAVRVSFSQALPLITFVQVLAQGALALIAGFAAYIGTLFLLRSDDAYSLLRGLERRLFKIGILPPSWDGEMEPPYRP